MNDGKTHQMKILILSFWDVTETKEFHITGFTGIEYGKRTYQCMKDGFKRVDSKDDFTLYSRP